MAALTARVVVTPLAGLVWPAPCVVVLTLRDADGVLTDCANAQIRRMDPAGNVLSLALSRISQGTYQAGSVDVPIEHANVGRWTYQGRSSVVSDLVTPATYQIAVTSDGLPIGAVPAAPISSVRRAILERTVTQAEIEAGASLQVACPFVPRAAIASVASGGDISYLVSCDGVHAYVRLAMGDGVNPPPFSDGSVVVITAVQ